MSTSSREWREGEESGGLGVIIATFASGVVLLAASLGLAGFLLGNALPAGLAPAIPASPSVSLPPLPAGDQRPGMAGTPSSARQSLIVDEAPTRFEVTLVGDWNPDAVDAADAGLRALARQIVATRPITMEIELAQLERGAQGQAGPEYTYTTGPTAPREQVLRAPALLAQDPTPPRGLASPHVKIRIGTDTRFDLGPSGRSTPAGDSLASVILHEAVHAIGFSDTVKCDRTACQLGFSRDGVRAFSSYDQYVVVGLSGERLADLPAASVYRAVTSNDLWFTGPEALALTGGRGIRLYAPATWREGSSVAHLHEDYRRTADALLTWDGGFPPGLELGPATRAILADLGWTLR